MGVGHRALPMYEKGLDVTAISALGQYTSTSNSWQPRLLLRHASWCTCLCLQFAGGRTKQPAWKGAGCCLPTLKPCTVNISQCCSWHADVCVCVQHASSARGQPHLMQRVLHASGAQKAADWQSSPLPMLLCYVMHPYIRPYGYVSRVGTHRQRLPLVVTDKHKCWTFCCLEP